MSYKLNYPIGEEPITTSRYLYEQSLLAEKVLEPSQVKDRIEKFFGMGFDDEEGAHGLKTYMTIFFWSLGLVSGAVSLANIPPYAHQVVEAYLKNTATRKRIEDWLH